MGRTCHFKSFSLWLSHCHHGLQKKSLQPSTAREKVTKSTELESLGKWVRGRMKHLQYHVVSSNIHLSSRLLSQDKLFPTRPSVEHSGILMRLNLGFLPLVKMNIKILSSAFLCFKRIELHSMCAQLQSYEA